MPQHLVGPQPLRYLAIETNLLICMANIVIKAEEIRKLRVEDGPTSKHVDNNHVTVFDYCATDSRKTLTL